MGALQDWDRDIFKIEVTGSGALDVRTTGDMDKLGFKFVSPNILIDFNDDAGEGLNTRMVTPFFRAFTVYVSVEARDGDPEGSYAFEASFNSDPFIGDTVEDTLADATLIPATGTLSEAIHFGADVDLYRIELTEFGTLTISSSGDTDLIGGFYDGDDKLLTFDNDSGPGTNFLFQSNVLAPGTYYVDVSSFLINALRGLRTHHFVRSLRGRNLGPTAVEQYVGEDRSGGRLWSVDYGVWHLRFDEEPVVEGDGRRLG